MKTRSLSRKRRGLILQVLLVIFLLLTLMLAVFQVTSATLTATMRTEAELEAQQQVKFQLLREIKGQDLTPASRMGLSINQSKDERYAGNLSSAQMFQTDGDGNWSGLPNLRQPQRLNYATGLQGFSGHRYFQYKVHGAGGDTQYAAVSGGASLYALLTCSSSSQAIQVSNLYHWINPLWGQAQEPLTVGKNADSTGPRVVAPGGVNITNMPSGEVYSGTNVTSGGVPFVVPDLIHTRVAVNPQQIAANLRGQIRQARQTLQNAGTSVDKTVLFNRPMSPDDALRMFFSQLALPSQYEDSLSVNQSQAFWLPTIPGFAAQFEILYHLILHIPDRPDGGLDEVSRAAHAVLDAFLSAVKTVLDAIHQLDKAKEALNKAQEAVDEAMDCGNCLLPWNWPCCAAKGVAELALEAAKIAVSIAEGVLETAVSLLMAICSPITDTLTAILAAEGQMPMPVSREDERTYSDRNGVQLDKGGMDAWAYRSAFNGIGKVFSDLFSGNFNQIGRDFGHDLTVVFFGQDQKQQNWNFDNNTISFRATLNVPRNRSLHLDQNVSISGDLWLGRGSCLVIDGNLNLVSGDPPSGGGTAPRGGLYLEEGSSLCVRGSVTLSGDRDGGSVVLAGPVNQVHPINSAIFCGGTFYAPYGVLPGVAPDELATVSGTDASKVEAATGFWRPLLRGTGPNLAKLAGPFWRRLPYIARYVTTFEYVNLEEIGFPFVIPEAWGNIHVWVFRALSALYAPTLNFELGENFMTHCDWWGRGGEGRVPIFVKPFAVNLAGNLSGRWDLGLTIAQNRLSNAADLISRAEVDKFSNGLCITLAMNWAKMIEVETGIPLVSVGEIIKALLEDINDHYYNLEEREDKLDEVVAKESWDELASQAGQFWARVVNTAQPDLNATLVQECPGVLVYAEGPINLGISGSRARLACGWFVSESDLNVQCDVLVGALTSLGTGRIIAHDVYFQPNFTRASLYIPPSESGDWRERGEDPQYAQDRSDSRSAEQRCVEIGLPERLVWLGKGPRK